MVVDIYVLDGGTWRGQYSFSNWQSDDQHCFQVEVPDGCLRHDPEDALEMPGGRILNASQVVDFCRVGVEGFSGIVPQSCRHLSSKSRR